MVFEYQVFTNTVRRSTSFLLLIHINSFIFLSHFQSSKTDQKPGGKKSRSQSLPAPSPSSAVVSTTCSPTASLCGGTMTRANGTGDCSSTSSSSSNNSNSTSPTVTAQGSRTNCDNKSMIEPTQLPALPDFNSFQRPADGLLLGKSGQVSNYSLVNIYLIFISKEWYVAEW